MDPLKPRMLLPGDHVRVLSPASTPDRQSVLRFVKILEGFGLTVSLGAHAFDKTLFLAGTDVQRLEDFNTALADPEVRAIVATRGGKGAYRLVDGLDYSAMQRDPKPIVGFSEISNLHLAMLHRVGVTGIHGPMASWSPDRTGEASVESLRRALMTTDDVLIRSSTDEATRGLSTTDCSPVSGALIGGNIDMIQTLSGWALPDLRGAILLIEGVGGGSGAPGGLGRLDRQLLHLTKNGHFDGVAGVAVGQFTNYSVLDDGGVLDVLGPHLDRLGVPVLGGLPLGHGKDPLTVPIGSHATLDFARETLRVAAGVQ